MNGFVKLFSDIIYSSVWQESNETRLVWITLLAMADRDGMVRAIPEAIAQAARVTQESCDNAILKFLAPDERSRSQEFDGRRMKRVDGGFLLLNYMKYRRKLSADERREYKRIKQAEYRSAKRNGPGSREQAVLRMRRDGNNLGADRAEDIESEMQ